MPDGFFEGFYTSVKEEIDANDAFVSIGLVKRPKPAMQPVKDVPAAIRATEKPVKKSGRIIRMGIIAAVSAVAATIALLVYLSPPADVQPILASATSATKPAESAEVLESYFAYLDEDGMIDYILENEISLDEHYDEAIYDIVESDIEDIYLDL